MFFSTIQTCGFTLVIPDSYGFCKAMGLGATASGLLVGVIHWATVLGACLRFSQSGWGGRFCLDPVSGHGTHHGFSSARAGTVPGPRCPPRNQHGFFM